MKMIGWFTSSGKMNVAERVAERGEGRWIGSCRDGKTIPTDWCGCYGGHHGNTRSISHHSPIPSTIPSNQVLTPTIIWQSIGFWETKILK
jgi:hypothetical protein